VEALMAYTINPAGLYTPASSLYEPEHRYKFTAESPAGPHVVIQGSAGAAEGALLGNEDEELANEYEVHLVVGPYWKYVDSAVPSVTINGFWNSNADEDDQQIWEVLDLQCDLVLGSGPHTGEHRLRLKFKVRVCGENSQIVRLGYYVFARGRELGDGGLNEPGPVRPSNLST
jgi:hypothetical protein